MDKYRGKHIVTGKWFYGTRLAESVIGKVEIVSDKDGLNQKPQIVEFCVVDPKTVGRYIGQKDKNGIEIYTGDYVALGDWWVSTWRQEELREVKWEDYEMGFTPFNERDDYGEGIESPSTQFCEVRGNVHDNKKRGKKVR